MLNIQYLTHLTYITWDTLLNIDYLTYTLKIHYLTYIPYITHRTTPHHMISHHITSHHIASHLHIRDFDKDLFCPQKWPGTRGRAKNSALKFDEFGSREFFRLVHFDLGLVLCHYATTFPTMYDQCMKMCSCCSYIFYSVYGLSPRNCFFFSVLPQFARMLRN